MKFKHLFYTLLLSVLFLSNDVVAQCNYNIAPPDLATSISTTSTFCDGEISLRATGCNAHSYEWAWSEINGTVYPSGSGKEISISNLPATAISFTVTVTDTQHNNSATNTTILDNSSKEAACSLVQSNSACSDLFNCLKEAHPDMDIFKSNIDDEGLWSDHASWSIYDKISNSYSDAPAGVIPSVGSLVYIEEGHKIKIKEVISQHIRIVKIRGELVFSKHYDTGLEVETIQVIGSSGLEMPQTFTNDDLVGGILRIGYNNNPIANNKSAVINFKSFDEDIDTAIADPRQLSRGLITHGDAKVRVYGQEKTSYVSANSIDNSVSGETTFHISESGDFSNWSVGDEIVVPSTIFERLEKCDIDDEKMIITAVDLANKIIKTSTNLIEERILVNKTDGSKFNLHLANLTRNITFRSLYPSNGTYNDLCEENINTKRNAHMMFMGKGDVIIQYAKLENMGRTNKAIPLDDIDVNTINLPNMGYCPGDKNNIRGRYALHFHKNNYNYSIPDLIDKYQARGDNFALVKGTVITGTPGWGFVNHSSMVNFIDNVCYDFIGGAFITESGDELGLFENNIAIRGIGDGEYRPTRLIFNNPGRPFSLSDFAFSGDGFWFQGPMVKVRNNIAANCNGAGMIWFTLGGIEPSNNYMVGAKEKIVDAVYTDYLNYDGCELTGDVITSSDLVNTSIFEPRKLKCTQDIFLADLPILECDNFKAYGCQAGFRMRFCNAPSTFVFGAGNFGIADIFGYKKEIQNTATKPDDDRFAKRLNQKVSNLELWNNEIGIRARYGFNTYFKNVDIANKLSYDENDVMALKGIETDHRIENYNYCNVHVNGYALANDVMEDYPEQPCNFSAADFSDPSNDLTNSVMVKYDNFSVFCPTPSNPKILNYNDAGSVTISWDSNEYIDKIGVRFREVNSEYWNHEWKTLLQGENITIIENLAANTEYEFQLISGCLENHNPPSYYPPFDNNNCPDAAGEYDAYPQDVGKNSNWSPDAVVFNTPCIDINAGYRVNNIGSDGTTSAWNLSPTNHIIHANCGDDVKLRIGSPSGINSGNPKWYFDGALLSPGNYGILDINNISEQDYGTYTVEYYSSENSCMSIKTFEVLPPSEVQLGHCSVCDVNNNEYDFQESNILYACVDGISTIKVLHDYNNFNIVWTDENKKILESLDPNSDNLTLPYNYPGLSPAQNTLRFYQTYTATIIAEGSTCPIVKSITVLPEGNMTCRAFVEPDPSPNSLLVPRPEWYEDSDCIHSFCQEGSATKFRIRMFTEGYSSTSTSTWYYTYDNGTDHMSIELAGSALNALIFEDFPIVKVVSSGKVTVNGGSSTTLSAGTYNLATDLSDSTNVGFGNYKVIIKDTDNCTTVRTYRLENDPIADDCPLDDFSSGSANTTAEHHKETAVAENSLIVYPNPLGNKQQLNLQFSCNTEQNINFKVYHMSGQFIKNMNMNGQKGENNKQVDIPSLMPGIYYITNQANLHARFIVL